MNAEEILNACDFDLDYAFAEVLDSHQSHLGASRLLNDLASLIQCRYSAQERHRSWVNIKIYSPKYMLLNSTKVIIIIILRRSNYLERTKNRSKSYEAEFLIQEQYVWNLLETISLFVSISSSVIIF